jgi:hypothetical protein
MKPNVPSQSPRFDSWRLVCRPEISLRLKLLFVGAATTFAFGLNPAVYALEPGRARVTSWACSPQGPYPAGWPVAEPDLSFALPHGIIRTGGLFDAVADFDAATLDPATGAVQPPVPTERHDRRSR